MTARVVLSMIDDNPYQVRTEYGDLSDLTESLVSLAEALPATSGLIQVPLARQVEGRVQLALGHRRRRAFMELARGGNGEYATLPVQIADLDNQAMADIAWSENEKRRDVSDVERALAIEIAMRDFGWTQTEVGRRWGISQPTVANLLRLLRLPEKVQGLIRQAAITGRHGRALLPLVDLEARWETYLDMLQDGAPGQYRSVESVEREVSGYITRVTYALEAVDWDANWDPGIEGLRACSDCPQQVKVGREFRCTSSGCFIGKGRAYRHYVEGPQKAAEIYRERPVWEAVNASSYARCAGCGRDSNKVYNRGQWLKSAWTYICPDCAQRAGLGPSPEEAPAPRPQPVYVRREEPVDVAVAAVVAQEDAWAQRVTEDAWAQKSETYAAQQERQAGLAGEIHTAPLAQAETSKAHAENIDALSTSWKFIIQTRIGPGDAVLVYVAKCGVEFTRLHEATGTMSDVERLFGEGLRVLDRYRTNGELDEDATLTDEPVLFCSQCRTRLSIVEFKINGLNGWADAKCPTCESFKRYMRTPATSWESVINLKNYYAYAARPNGQG